MLIIRCMLYKPFHVYTTFSIVNSTIALNQSLICIIGLCLDCEVYLKACIDPRFLCDHNPCTQFSCSSTYNTQTYDMQYSSDLGIHPAVPITITASLRLAHA